MKTLLTILICTLFLCSCARYTQAGQGGCYFQKVKQHTTKNVVRIR